MIGVVCLNPALDITHHVAAVDWVGVNRPSAVHARAGGKGLNVSALIDPRRYGSAGRAAVAAEVARLLSVIWRNR
jgi:hypothetical protein